MGYGFPIIIHKRYLKDSSVFLGEKMHVVHLERDSLLQDARAIPIDYIVV